MRFDDLDDDEKEVIERLRKLSQSQKKAIAASQESFKTWLKTSCSSIWNKISSVFGDLWSWLRGSINPKGKFHSVWVDHNCYKNNEKGMNIHAKFEVDNLKGVDCKAAAYFYYSSGGKLRDSNNSYCTNDGYVSSYGVGFTPTYDGALYSDLELFMPYDELHLSNGKHELKFYIALYVVGGDFFADSNWVYFTYTS